LKPAFAKQRMLLVLELLAQLRVLLLRYELAESGEEHRILASRMWPVHPNEGLDRSPQPGLVLRCRRAPRLRQAAHLLGERPAALMLDAQRADQLDEGARSLEAREEELFFW